MMSHSAAEYNISPGNEEDFVKFIEAINEAKQTKFSVEGKTFNEKINVQRI